MWILIRLIHFPNHISIFLKHFGPVKVLKPDGPIRHRSRSSQTCTPWPSVTVYSASASSHNSLRWSSSSVVLGRRGNNGATSHFATGLLPQFWHRSINRTYVGLFSTPCVRHCLKVWTTRSLAGGCVKRYFPAFGRCSESRYDLNRPNRVQKMLTAWRASRVCAPCVWPLYRFAIKIVRGV